MKIIINESQLRLIVENEGKLFNVPEDIFVNEVGEYNFEWLANLFERDKIKKGWTGIKIYTTLDLENYYLNTKEIKIILNNLVEVDGSLYMGSKGGSLPKLRKVYGDFNLLNSKIKSLPMLEYVEGELDLTRTPITELPMLSSVGGYLNLYKTPLSKTTTEEELRNKIEVKGNIYL